MAEGDFSKLARRLDAADGMGVEYGVAAVPHRSGMTAEQLAAIHVRGKAVPKRDFMAIAAEDLRVIAPRLLARIARDVLRGKSPRRSLETLREAAEEAVSRAIDTFYDPENAPSTIRRKGRDDPLVDSGDMREAAFAEIDD